MDKNKVNSNPDLAEEIEERREKIWKLYTDGIHHVENISIPESEIIKDTDHRFSDFIEIHKKAEEATRQFEEILSSTMEENRLPQYLHSLLEEQKAEASSILKTYDDIIQHLTNDLNEKDRDYREKCEMHSMQQELIRKRIEDFISELNRVGKGEIRAIRKAIVNHTQKVSDQLMKNNDDFINTNEADIAFDSYLWKVLSETISLKQLEDAFVIDQKDTFKLRRKLLSEVCKLRKDLETDKLDYNLQKQVCEQEIFYLKETYLRSMPISATMKRKCIAFHDKKANLLAQLKKINDKLTKETRVETKKLTKKMTEKLERYSKEHSIKFKAVFEDKDEEVRGFLTEIYQTQRLIYRSLFNLHWEQPNLNHQENQDLSKLQEEYWNAYLNHVMKDQLISDALLALNKYRQSLEFCSRLKKKKENMYAEIKELRKFLKNYTKLKVSCSQSNE